MTTRHAVSSPAVAAPLAHVFSQAIIDENRVFCSGTIGLSSDGSKLVDGGIQGQTEQTLANMEAVLKAAGSDLGKVIKVNVYIKDYANFAAMNEVYVKKFTPPMPARTCVGVKELPFGAEVEIECVARL